VAQLFSLDGMAMRYSLREATPDDRTFAETLHERCYKDVVVRQFGAWDAVFQKQSFEHKWHPEHFQIIVASGVAVGVLSVEPKPDHLFLSEIQIDPSAQNQGFGSAILAGLFERARSLGVPIRLRVLRCSRAVTFYERMGFRSCGQTDTHLLFERSYESAV
jgi:GNAT superfamily N-acetyltransferase